MPSFYCTHCGQHIDAPDELAGTHAACPTCGGGIQVPGFVPFKPQTRETGPGFWSARSIPAIIGGVVVIAGIALLWNFNSRSSTLSYSRSPRPEEIESARKTISGIEDDMKSLMKESTGPDGLPRKTDFRLRTEKPATDDMQRLRELMQSFFNDMVGLQNDYVKALEDDGIDTLLDANRIARDREFKQSRETLAKVKRTVADTKARATRILADFPERVKNQGFESSNQSMLEGYREGMKKTLPLFRKIWELESETVDHMEDLINHLEATRQYWKPDEGTFLFERDHDTEKFNELMGKISACVERQMEIRQNSMKSAQDKIGSLKDLIPK